MPRKTLVTLRGISTVIRWEQFDGSSWSTIANTNATHSFSNLAATTQFRAVVQIGSCAAANSSATLAQVGYMTYGGSLLLTSLSDASNVYQWYKNGASIGGATSQTLSVTEPAMYTVKVTASPYVTGVFFVVPTLTNVQQAVNAVSQTVFLKSGLTETSNFYTLQTNESAQSITYQDGLGRPFQSVSVMQSPDQKDIIGVSADSKNGLADTTYLPFVSTSGDGRFRLNAIRGTANTYSTSEQYQFYQGTAKVAVDSYPFARTLRRNTPDGKVIEQGAPGADWQPGNHTVRNLGSFNYSTYPVRLWKPDGTTTANYPDYSVLVTTLTDENNHKVRTFTNTLGQTVLKRVEVSSGSWLDTYNVYDDYGRLVYQLPPRALEVLGAGSSLDANSASVSELIYKYSYDSRGRLITKKVPGAAEQYLVYDIYDRLVLTQDGNLRGQSKWLFIKYDQFGRTVISGLYTNSRSLTSVQKWATKAYTASSSSYPYANFAEDKSNAGGSAHGYTNISFPKDSTTYLAVSYYDNYDFDANGSADYTYDASHLSGSEAAASSATRNLPTGSKRVTLDAAGNISSTWLISVVFYDSFDRAIQTLSNNHLYTTLADKATVIYDFAGHTIKSKNTHNGSSTSSVVINDRPEYDHAWRLKKANRSFASSVEWGSLVGVSATGSTITKTAATNAWDAGAYSIGFIPASTDGSLEFKAASTTGNKMMGLSSSNPNVSYTSIAYAIYAKGGGNVEIWESNANKGTYGTYTASDVFSIERTGTTIVYKKNGTTLYTSATTTSAALYADCSLYATGASFVSVNLVGKEYLLAQYEYNALGQLVDKKLHDTGGGAFIQSVDYRYNIRGWLRSINNASLTSNSDNDETNDVFGMELFYNSSAGVGNAVSYTGKVSAVKYKSLGMGGTMDQRSFKYYYDYSDRLIKATFQAADSTASWTKEVGTLNESFSYDLNGNLKTLGRFRNLRGISGSSPHTVTSTPEKIDSLAYTYLAVSGGTQNSNTLIKVEDVIGGATGQAGFNNGTVNGSNEYTYNTDGSLTKDDNKGISSITYNALGKPMVVNFTSGKKIEYSYDAAGVKLNVKTYDGATLLTSTDYVGGFVYESSSLSFFSSTEGRVAKANGNLEYQYAIKDQLGNTRALITSVTPPQLSITATFEGNSSDNASQFSNVSNIVTFSAANHTSGGSKVIRMNQSYAVGPAKKLKVYPGDQVDVEVWTYYETASGYGTSSPTVAAMVSSIATAFGGVNGGSGESGMIYTAVNSALGVFGLSGNQGNTAPAAYLNYMLYDQNYNLLKMGWKVVPTSANFAKQKISFSTFNIKEPGILFVYLSYEDLSNNYVYFDDFKVQHTKSIVIQGNEYYPFGMQTVNCWTRENNTANNFLANGGTEYNATSSLYDLDYRTFDPVLGRMNGVDPMAAKYAGLSPYNYSFNDPVNFADPGGADPSDPNYAYNPGGTDYGDPNWLTRYVWSGYINGAYTGYDVALNPRYGTFVQNDVNRIYGARLDWQESTFAGMSRGGSVTIDFSALSDGVHHFGFSDGKLSSYAFISGEEIGQSADLSGTFNSYSLGLNYAQDSNGKLIPGTASFAFYSDSRGPSSGNVIFHFVSYTESHYSETEWEGLAGKSIDNMSSVLSSSSVPISNLVIVAHGNLKEIHLGSDILSRTDIVERRGDAMKFNAMLKNLASGGNVVLVSCNSGLELANVMAPFVRPDLNVYMNRDASSVLSSGIPFGTPLTSPESLYNGWAHIRDGMIQENLKNVIINRDGSVKGISF